MADGRWDRRVHAGLGSCALRAAGAHMHMCETGRCVQSEVTFMYRSRACRWAERRSECATVGAHDATTGQPPQLNGVWQMTIYLYKTEREREGAALLPLDKFGGRSDKEEAWERLAERHGAARVTNCILDLAAATRSHVLVAWSKRGCARSAHLTMQWYCIVAWVEWTTGTAV